LLFAPIHIRPKKLIRDSECHRFPIALLALGNMSALISLNDNARTWIHLAGHVTPAPERSVSPFYFLALLQPNYTERLIGGENRTPGGGRRRRGRGRAQTGGAPLSITPNSLFPRSVWPVELPPVEETYWNAAARSVAPGTPPPPLIPVAARAHVVLVLSPLGG